MKKTFFIGILKYAVAIAILLWLWRSDRIDFSILNKILSLKGVITVFGLGGISLLLYTARLHLLLRSQNLVHSFGQTWRLSMIGLFFNFTLPGGTSGDLLKVYYLNKMNHDQKPLVVATVALDRIVGLLGMLSMAVMALLLRPSELVKEYDLQILFFSSLGLFLFLMLCLWFSRRWSDGGRYQNLFRVWPRLPIALKAIGLTLLSQSTAVMMLYFGAVLAGYEYLDWVSFFTVAPLGFILMAIPIAPAGIGVGQVAFYALFKMYTGQTSDLGPSVVTLYQIVLFTWSLLGLYCYLRSEPS